MDIVGRSGLSDNSRLASHVVPCRDIPGRGDGIGRRSGLKHRRRKAWGFDFPPRHQEQVSSIPGIAAVQASHGRKAGIPDYTCLSEHGLCFYGGNVVISPNAGVSLTILRALPIFETLDDDCLKPLTRVAMLRAVPRHTVVLHAGDRTDNIYFVLSGGLKVQVSDEEGREVILSMLGPGELFGEMGVLDDHPRSATVLAVEQSEVVVIGKDDFKRCLVDNPDVSLFIMRNLAKRLRLADRNIESLALLDVYGRVARLLLEAAETIDGRKVVTHKLTKQDIAKMIGASREMVSRVMRDLTAQGLIHEQDGQLILIDLAAFRRHGDVDAIA